MRLYTYATYRNKNFLFSLISLMEDFVNAVRIHERSTINFTKVNNLYPRRGSIQIERISFAIFRISAALEIFNRDYSLALVQQVE